MHLQMSEENMGSVCAFCSKGGDIVPSETKGKEKSSGQLLLKIWASYSESFSSTSISFTDMSEI